MKFILDPLWITKSNYLDSEYFNYILLDASVKYKEEIKKENIDNFYEILFHLLNLNNLAVNGYLFTSKFKQMWNDEKLVQIKEDLKHLYDTPSETANILKNANFVFLNLLLENMQVHMKILDKVKLYYINQVIHDEPEVFIITNKKETPNYRIWKLEIDKTKDFGYSFKKIKTVRLPEIKENMLRDEIAKLGDPQLETVSGKKNICLAVIQENEDERTVAKAVKDIILLNKGIAKKMNFEPMIIAELYQHLWVEKLMPFTLDQWLSESV